MDDIRDNLGGHHRLMSDLDSTTDGYQELTSPTANWGKGWQPIGTFTGSFDGHGYEIRDLFIDRPDESGVGLFGYVAEGGVVEDIGVVNATVTGKDNVGGLVGYNEKSSVSKSYSTGNVMGNTDFGGLVGLNNEGTVSSNSFWDTQTSGRTISAGGTGKTTAGMQDITTFLGARWNIYAVAPGQTSPAYIWNIVNGQTYPFLRWQSVS